MTEIKPCGCSPCTYCNTCQPGRFDMEYGPCRKELARIKELENDYAQLLQQFGSQTEEVRKLEKWQKEVVPLLEKLFHMVGPSHQETGCRALDLIKQAEEK